MRLTIILLLLISFASLADELKTPLMPTLILKQAADSKVINSHQCHQVEIEKKQSLSSSKSVNTDSFEATISCEYQCLSGKKVEKVLTRSFNPVEHGLSPGDGSSERKIIWRYLGTTIDLWSHEQCYKLAKSECSQIKTFDVSKVTSGDWIMDTEYSCSNTETIYSPFDDGLNLVQKTGIAPKYKYDSAYDFSFDRPLAAVELSNYLPRDIEQKKLDELFIESDRHFGMRLSNWDEKKLKCKKMAKVSTCFGDCIFEVEGREHWRESISTAGYLGDYKTNICLDSFKESFDKLSTKIEKRHLCHKLIWEIFRRSKALGTSCAAFRFDYSCPYE